MLMCLLCACCCCSCFQIGILVQDVSGRAIKLIYVVNETIANCQGRQGNQRSQNTVKIKHNAHYLESTVFNSCSGVERLSALYALYI